MSLIGTAYGCASLFIPPETRGIFFLPPSQALITTCLGIAVAGSLFAQEKYFAPLRITAGTAALLFALWLPISIATERWSSTGNDKPDPLRLWAEKTPPHSLYLISPQHSGFRLRSRRRVYAEWSDFNLALFDRDAAFAWKKRMQSLGVDWTTLRRARREEFRVWDQQLLRRSGSWDVSSSPLWKTHDAAALAVLAKSKNAQFLVSREELPLKSAFEIEDQIIYRIP